MQCVANFFARHQSIHVNESSSGVNICQWTISKCNFPTYKTTINIIIRDTRAHTHRINTDFDFNYARSLTCGVQCGCAGESGRVWLFDRDFQIFFEKTCPTLVDDLDFCILICNCLSVSSFLCPNNESLVQLPAFARKKSYIQISLSNIFFFCFCAKIDRWSLIF